MLLLNKIIFLIVMVFLIFIFSLSQNIVAQTYVSGDVSGTWTAEQSPYYAFGDISVPNDSTLNIDAGVEVVFWGSYNFTVNGLLMATGVIDNRITFHGGGAQGAWRKIYFSESAAAGCVLNYCTIKDGGGFDELCTIHIFHNDTNVTISNCEIYNGAANGIYVQSYIKIEGGNYITKKCNPFIVNNSIHHHSRNGIYLNAYYNCTSNRYNGHYITSIVSPVITNNVIYANDSTGIQCYTYANGSVRGGGDLNPVIQTNPTIQQNTIYGNGANGAHCCKTIQGGFNGIIVIETDPLITSNIIANNGEYGLNVNEVSIENVRNNCFWENDSSNFKGSGGGLGYINQTNVIGDSCDITYNIFFAPEFVDASNYDFHLMSTSKCINAGDLSLPWDNDGSFPDIGAFSAYILKASFNSNVTSGYVPLQVQFTSTSTQGANPITSYFWYFGDEQTSTKQNPTHNYNSDGQFTVSLIVSDGTLSDTLTKTNYITVYKNEYNLFQNYPNPFNSSTMIQYELPKESKVVLTIFNPLGQKINTLINEIQDSGNKLVVWDGKNNLGQVVSSGIYIYKLKAGTYFQSHKMLLLK